MRSTESWVLVAVGSLWMGMAVLAVPGAIAMALLLTLRRRVPDPAVYDGGPAASTAVPPAVGRRGWWAEAVGAWLAGKFTRRQAEAARRIERETVFNEKILANMPSGIALVDPSSRTFLQANEAFVNMAKLFGEFPEDRDNLTDRRPGGAAPHGLACSRMAKCLSGPGLWRPYTFSPFTLACSVTTLTTRISRV